MKGSFGNAKRYVSWLRNGKVIFFQLIHNGRVLETYCLRIKKRGWRMSYPSKHQRWGYDVMVYDDYLTIVNLLPPEMIRE